MAGESVNSHITDGVSQARDWLVGNSDLFVQYCVNIVSAILILVIGNIVVKVVTGTTRSAMQKRNIDKAVTDFIYSIVRYALLIMVLVAALGRIGVETASVIAVIGAAGLAVGLALKGSLSNFASGVLIVIFRPFKSGDYIEAAGVAGSVQSIQIFQTVLKTGDNKMVVVPNSSVMKGPITNYSRYNTRRINFEFSVSYKADLKKAKEVLRETVERDPRVLKEPGVNIGVSALRDSSVSIVVRPWVNKADYWAVYWDLTQAVKEALDENGIEIPFPQMDVHLSRAE